MKTLIILSGGMDSTTLLYDLHAQGDELYALSFYYGSKHNDKELTYARYHCEKLGVPHQVIRLDFVKNLFKSSLLQGQEEVPEGHYTDETMKSTVVPFRNGIMLSIAVGYAESIGVDRVVLASHAGDHAIYPDCRPEFTQAINLVAQLGTYKKIRIESPYNYLHKGEIALIGLKLGIDYSKTWTCYKGLDEPCGKCGACVERQEALEWAREKLKST